MVSLVLVTGDTGRPVDARPGVAAMAGAAFAVLIHRVQGRQLGTVVAARTGRWLDRTVRAMGLVTVDTPAPDLCVRSACSVLVTVRARKARATRTLVRLVTLQALRMPLGRGACLGLVATRARRPWGGRVVRNMAAGAVAMAAILTRERRLRLVTLLTDRAALQFELMWRVTLLASRIALVEGRV
mgnify:CR=1 FL=1